MLVSLSVALSGCATMRYPSDFKVEGKEFKDFKELDDEKALKVVALIYNVKHDTWEDVIARNLALEEYLELLGKRRSQYLKNSGIFEVKYEKANLSAWGEDDLIKLYDALLPKTDPYYMDSASELSEKQNAERIVYLTAVCSIASEMKRRNIKKNAIVVGGQILSTVLMIALSLI
ncbi:MAG: hypothetical protein WC592_07710 [Candidatus Omnitrophota bacterium]